jgi:hypothetical protein
MRARDRLPGGAEECLRDPPRHRPPSIPPWEVRLFKRLVTVNHDLRAVTAIRQRSINSGRGRRPFRWFSRLPVAPFAVTQERRVGAAVQVISWHSARARAWPAHARTASCLPVGLRTVPEKATGSGQGIG